RTVTGVQTCALPILGIGLGVAEAAVSLLLASSAIAATIPLRFAQLGRDATFELSIVGRGGWIRSYSHALDLLPIPAALAVILLPDRKSTRLNSSHRT